MGSLYRLCDLGNGEKGWRQQDSNLESPTQDQLLYQLRYVQMR